MDLFWTEVMKRNHSWNECWMGVLVGLGEGIGILVECGGWMEIWLSWGSGWGS